MHRKILVNKNNGCQMRQTPDNLASPDAEWWTVTEVGHLVKKEAVEFTPVEEPTKKVTKKKRTAKKKTSGAESQ